MIMSQNNQIPTHLEAGDTITQSELKELMIYDVSTGIFKYKTLRSGIRKDLIAGSLQNNGYHYIQICGRKYFAHRLAFLYVVGRWPADQVDHINDIKNDNRWCNLRDCTGSQNQANKSIQRNNTSGYKGVHKVGNRWRALIYYAGCKISLGNFSCKHTAAKQYNDAATKYHGDFACLNVLKR